MFLGCVGSQQRNDSSQILRGFAHGSVASCDAGGNGRNGQVGAGQQQVGQSWRGRLRCGKRAFQLLHNIADVAKYVNMHTVLANRSTIDSVPEVRGKNLKWCEVTYEDFMKFIR